MDTPAVADVAALADSALYCARLAAAATQTVCVDFDGTLTRAQPYAHGPATAPPSPGMRDALRRLADMGLRIVVLTARPPSECYAWLQAQDVLQYVREVTNVKPPAFAYIDDRGVHFDGRWDTALQYVRGLMRTPPVPQTDNDSGSVAAAADFDESAHPRDEHGRFTDAGSGAPPRPDPGRFTDTGTAPREGELVRLGNDVARVAHVHDAVEPSGHERWVLLDRAVKGTKLWPVSALRRVEQHERLAAAIANDWERARDALGRFEPGDGTPAAALPHIRETRTRAFDASAPPRAVRLRLTKTETGRLGERLVIAYLQSLGHADARPLNARLANFAVDLVQDHELIEVKAGLVSNSARARQWRVTLGEPSDAEKARLAKMTDAQKERYNARKQEAAHARKKAVLAELRTKTGRNVRPATMTLIIDPDNKRADLYRFSGFHSRIGWTSEEAQTAYVTTLAWSDADTLRFTRRLYAAADFDEVLHPRDEHGRFTDKGSGVRTDSPAFKAWFKDSKVVDDEGRPRVVYHGTTHDIATFDPAVGNTESSWGRGIYVTSDPRDASVNYAGEGPDLTNRIERRAEQIEQDAEDTESPVTRDAAMEQARTELSGGKPNVMPVYLALQNPVVVGGEHETRFDSELEYADPNDPESDITGEHGTLPAFVTALRDAAAAFDGGEGDATRAADVLVERLADYLGDSVGVSMVLRLWQQVSASLAVVDDNGNLASDELLRSAFERAGFDGVIDQTVNARFGSQRTVGRPMTGMDENTVHYVAFKPEQVKSAIGNRGAFDPTNPRIDAAAHT